MKIKLIIWLILVLAVSSGTLSAAPSEPVLTFWDDFEHRILGQSLMFGEPVVGRSYALRTGGVFDVAITDEVLITDSTRCVFVRENPRTAVSMLPQPYMPFYEGLTVIAETHVYMPATPAPGAGAYFGLDTGTGMGTQPALLRLDRVLFNNDNWWYTTKSQEGVHVWYDSGVSADVDRWYHIKIELHDDLTWNAWVTPDGVGQQPRQIVWKAPVVGRDLGFELGQSLRGIFSSVGPPDSKTYYDNITTHYIDNNAAGYPPIYEKETPIVIDGQLDMAEEWSSSTKVATKPNDSRGNFVGIYMNEEPIATDTEVDVYVTYDMENFYIGSRFTNALVYPDDGSIFEAIFTFPASNIGEEDTSYCFRVVSTSAQGNENGRNGTCLVYTGNNEPVMSQMDPNDLWDSGAQMNYVVVDEVIEIEMKIPFSLMPQFNGVLPGKQIELQFNVRDNTMGFSTTSLTRERYYRRWDRGRAQLPGVGIAFAQCGDEDNTLPGDLTGNCRVNIEDLNVIVENWLQCTAPICD